MSFLYVLTADTPLSREIYEAPMNAVDWCEVDWRLGEKARRVLQASAIESFGREGVYATMSAVMRRANITDPEEFSTIAEYLEEQGLIAEADADYGIFVLTYEGIDLAEH
jgi:RIO-like serine/threonine protein kinase